MKSFSDLQQYLNTHLGSLILDSEDDLAPVLTFMQSMGVLMKDFFEEDIFALAHKNNLPGIREIELLEVVKQLTWGPDYLEIWTKENKLYKRKPQDLVLTLSKYPLKKEDYITFLCYIMVPEHLLRFQLIHILMK